MSETVALHHQIDGPEGAPVVVLGSSIGTSGAMWEPQVAALSRRYRVVRYDLRGHGRSPVPRGGYSLDDLGRDVLALLDHLGLEKVAYGGLSLGGMVGMWLGIHAPERITSLVLCCTSAYLGPPERWVERIDLVRREGTQSLVEAMAPRWFSAATLSAAPPFVRQLTQGMADTPDEGYAGCSAAIGEMDLRDQIHAITAPPSSSAGPRTPHPAAHVARDLRADRPLELVLLPDSAHLATVEQPERSHGGHPRPPRRLRRRPRARHGDPPSRAGRRPRRPRHRRHDPVLRTLPGPHHPLRVG
jgi:3-oxoadipate enol-lactonase